MAALEMNPVSFMSFVTPRERKKIEKAKFISSMNLSETFHLGFHIVHWRHAGDPVLINSNKVLSLVRRPKM